MKCSVKQGFDIQGLIFLVFLTLGFLSIHKQGFLQSTGKHLFHTNYSCFNKKSSKNDFHYTRAFYSLVCEHSDWVRKIK